MFSLLDSVDYSHHYGLRKTNGPLPAVIRDFRWIPDMYSCPFVT